MSRRNPKLAALSMATLMLAACGGNELSEQDEMGDTADLAATNDATSEEKGLPGVSRLGASGKTVSIHPLGDKSLCLDVAASNNADGGIVQVYRCNGTDAQKWVQTGKSFVAFGNKCLNLKDGGKADGTRLQIWTCDPATTTDKNNAWTVNGDTLRSQKINNKCLDITNGVYRDRTPVQIWSCSANNINQKWSIQATGSSATNASGSAGSAGSSTGTSSLNLPTASNDSSGIGGSPRSYSGPAINFPNDPAKWASWDQLWSTASGQMPNTAQQTEWVRQAILQEAKVTGMDPRFILAVVMQESSGNVRVWSTNNGVNNPGLMQSHNGVSFSDNGDGGKASIFQMVKDGCEGTKYGDGLIQGLKKSKNYFAAGRLYNSGAIDNNNLSNAMGATGSYASDLANRVMGRM